MSQFGDLMAGPPPTYLPDEPQPREALAQGAAPVDVAAGSPTSSLAWALLAEAELERIQAGADGPHTATDTGTAAAVAAYAYARTGYHRGLDALRRNGWKGHGPIPWSHEPNRGFLRALAALSRAAELIGDDQEAARCAQFLADSDRQAATELGW